MTNENKAGIAVSVLFLCLASTVAFVRMRGVPEARGDNGAEAEMAKLAQSPAPEPVKDAPVPPAPGPGGEQPSPPAWTIPPANAPAPAPLSAEVRNDASTIIPVNHNGAENAGAPTPSSVPNAAPTAETSLAKALANAVGTPPPVAPPVPQNNAVGNPAPAAANTASTLGSGTATPGPTPPTASPVTPAAGPTPPANAGGQRSFEEILAAQASNNPTAPVPPAGASSTTTGSPITNTSVGSPVPSGPAAGSPPPALSPSLGASPPPENGLQIPAPGKVAGNPPGLGSPAAASATQTFPAAAASSPVPPGNAATPPAPPVSSAFPSPAPIRPATAEPPRSPTPPSPVVPPIGTPPAVGAPPIRVPAVPATPSQPQVEVYDEVTYRSKVADTMESICKEKYGAEKYAPALLQFNRNHFRPADGILQQPPVLQLNQPVYLPPVAILERHYANLIPGGVEPQQPTAMLVPPASPSAPPRTPAAAGRTYRVRPESEMISDIAKRTLGSLERWPEILRLNPQYNPAYPLRPGTVLRMPADAQIDAADAP